MPDTTHIIRVTLNDDPPLHRDIELPGSQSLFRLAEGIVAAFDFDMDHAFGFYSGLTGADLMEKLPKYELFTDMGMNDNGAQGVKKTPVASAYADIGSQLIFLFDYGDEWLFHTEVIGFGEKVPRRRYPRVVASVGEAPLQYPDPDDDDWDDEDWDEEDENEDENA
ncbi:IS1096 element passenger TnpR family protein [Roseospirillum parvum]|uniref:PRiA4b ORF-3-like protein n=1 Tax=Roseospirillum parvum TaxID=83401 RepID=A0A1G8G9R8_9PROT|nr:hypothetical protein [Roseospirillum parvum]SDH91132.1 pRiA4b ORF-3-like protein [Roseospirillum parvum]